MCNCVDLRLINILRTHYCMYTAAWYATINNSEADGCSVHKIFSIHLYKGKEKQIEFLSCDDDGGGCKNILTVTATALTEKRSVKNGFSGLFCLKKSYLCWACTSVLVSDL